VRRGLAAIVLALLTLSACNEILGVNERVLAEAGGPGEGGPCMQGGPCDGGDSATPMTIGGE
jgi:hypothetical protein